MEPLQEWKSRIKWRNKLVDYHKPIPGIYSPLYLWWHFDPSNACTLSSCIWLLVLKQLISIWESTMIMYSLLPNNAIPYVLLVLNCCNYWRLWCDEKEWAAEGRKDADGFLKILVDPCWWLEDLFSFLSHAASFWFAVVLLLKLSWTFLYWWHGLLVEEKNEDKKVARFEEKPFVTKKQPLCCIICCKRRIKMFNLWSIYTAGVI